MFNCKKTLLTVSIFFLASDSAIASQWHKIAYSKKLDIQIYAPLVKNQWCAETMEIKVETSNIANLTSEEGSKFFSKVGPLLGKRCKAKSATFTAISGNNTVLYQARSDISNRWQPQVLYPVAQLKVVPVKEEIVTAKPMINKSVTPQKPPAQQDFLAEIKALQAEHQKQTQKTVISPKSAVSPKPERQKQDKNTAQKPVSSELMQAEEIDI